MVLLCSAEMLLVAVFDGVVSVGWICVGGGGTTDSVSFSRLSAALRSDVLLIEAHESIGCLGSSLFDANAVVDTPLIFGWTASGVVDSSANVRGFL